MDLSSTQSTATAPITRQQLNSVFQGMFQKYLEIESGPTLLQDEALYQMFREDGPARILGVFASTGGGKSAIAQIAGALFSGITLCLLPNLALQSMFGRQS